MSNYWGQRAQRSNRAASCSQTDRITYKERQPIMTASDKVPKNEKMLFDKWNF